MGSSLFLGVSSRSDALSSAIDDNPFVASVAERIQPHNGLLLSVWQERRSRGTSKDDRRILEQLGRLFSPLTRVVTLAEARFD